MPDVYLYNVDDLQTIANDYLKQRHEEIARCERIIAEKIKPLLQQKREDGEWKMEVGKTFTPSSILYPPSSS